jgi:hypothetical protein
LINKCYNCLHSILQHVSEYVVCIFRIFLPDIEWIKRKNIEW